ncbi:MAG TPA: AAA family ATPase, partial [Nocardioidaceae bacterium]|nr:AAA family ATPase [Nocardioidaceae bacterium]
MVGLAPSAAAAAILGEQTRIRTDTLAKLTWSLQHSEVPDGAARIGPSTLVIIDEAGMADTLSLDTAVQFMIARGGSVRLVGDDRQLAAIGAGGVLRDITHIHGALRLTELHRFTGPAEAAASLAIREGDPSGLEFYLDHGRIHVGDIATTAWQRTDPKRDDHEDLAAHVRRAPNEDSTPPVWATPGSQPSVALIGEVEVWRPPTRSTGRTTDPQEQDNCRSRPPSGNTTSTEVLRTAATTSVGRMPKPASLP